MFVRVWVSPPQLQRSCNITCAKRKYHCCKKQQYHARIRAYHFHRLAARVPSFKLRIPCIRTLRISIRLSTCVRSTPTPSRQSCEIVAGVFVPARTDSKDFLRGSNYENKRGRWQSPLCLRFYLGDSHVALLLGMTALWAVAIT